MTVQFTCFRCRRTASLLSLIAGLHAAATFASPMWEIPMTQETAHGLDHIQVRLGGSDSFANPTSSTFFFIDDQGSFIDEGMTWGQQFHNDSGNFAVFQGPDLGAGTLSFTINVLGEYDTHQPAFHYQAYRDGQLVANNDFSAVGPDDTDWDAYAGTWQQNTPLWPDFTPGDANRDGAVDIDDFFVWQTNYTGRDGEGKTWEEGDWTGDGAVHIDDFFAWQTNYTGRIGPPPLATLSTVPEPSAGLLLVLGLVLSLGKRSLNGRRIL